MYRERISCTAVSAGNPSSTSGPQHVPKVSPPPHGHSGICELRSLGDSAHDTDDEQPGRANLELDMSSFSPLRALARREPDSDNKPLRVRSCRDLCNWNETPVQRRDESLFACRGCGSQWVPSEHWTPREASGTIPAPVLDIIRNRE